jgi:hypothetical protein
MQFMNKHCKIMFLFFLINLAHAFSLSGCFRPNLTAPPLLGSPLTQAGTCLGTCTSKFALLSVAANKCVCVPSLGPPANTTDCSDKCTDGLPCGSITAFSGYNLSTNPIPQTTTVVAGTPSVVPGIAGPNQSQYTTQKNTSNPLLTQHSWSLHV